MLRALFLEYPDDPTSWLIEDQYMFGSDLLVAPMIEEGEVRKVYLPPGSWIDYQTAKAYRGAEWHEIKAGTLPVVLMVKDNIAIPHAKPAQNTAQINWNEIELRVFSTGRGPAAAMFALPQTAETHSLSLDRSQRGWVLRDDPLRGRVKWEVTRPDIR
jgi:alpha-D-xyloside xylohydrolase